MPELWDVPRAHPLGPPDPKRGDGNHFGFQWTYATVKGNANWKGVFGYSTPINQGWTDPDLKDQIFTKPQEIKNPSKVAALIDFSDKYVADNTSGDSGQNYIIPHIRRLNVLYADWHVESYVREDFFPPFTGSFGSAPFSTFNTWARDVWDIRY